MKLESSFETERMDLAQVPAVVRLVLDQFRSITFDRGAALHPTTGIRLEGLANLSGSHPQAGSEYTVVTAIEELPPLTERQQAEFDALVGTDPIESKRKCDEWLEQHRTAAKEAHRIQTFHQASNVRLVADDRRRVSFDVSDTGPNPFDASVRIEPPERPTRVHIDLTMPASGHWFVAGDVQVDVRIDIEPLTRTGADAGATTVLEVDGRHRRGRGTVTIAVTDTGLGMWAVDVSVCARGAGWFRPIAAVIALATRRKLQGELDKVARPDSDIVTEIRDGLADVSGKSPDVIADEMFAGIVETLPPQLLLR